jgi:cobalt-zinc-cadmium efflux system outer membrane protein
VRKYSMATGVSPVRCTGDGSMFNSKWRIPCAVAIACLGAGCASLPLEQGRSKVDALLRSRATPVQLATFSQRASGDARGVEAQIAQWLREPLSSETAQRIALLRNPRLQAELARLGLGAADVFEAQRLQNPAISLSWLFPLGDAQGDKAGAAATFGFTDLLMRGSKLRVARAQYQQVQAGVAAAVLTLLADTQQAWLECVAAMQRVAVRASIADAAALGADLAAKYFEAGNLSQLELQVQRAEASQARIELRSSQMELADARAALQRQLGLRDVEPPWTVPGTLPEIPATAAALQAAPLVALALQQRLDVAAARQRVQTLQLRQDFVRRYRLLADTRLGAQYEREADASKRLGPTLELTLPVFQQGQGAVARAEAQLASGRAALEELEIATQTQVEQQLRRLDLARMQAAAFRDGLIPQREAIVARMKEQANFMLVDSFAVLLARQQEYAAYAGYIDAVLRYWIAQNELLRATGSLRSVEAQP